MRTGLLTAAVLLTSASAALAVEPIELEQVASGFTAPIHLEEPNDGTGRLFLVDQVGTIWIIMPDGTVLDQPFLDIADRMVELDPNYDERGLLGMALHPDYANNGRFFVAYSAPLRDEAPDTWNHTMNISEFQVSLENPDVADASSERLILAIDEPQGNHNVSTLAFGPDGYLYMGVGDGGGANDVGEGHVDDWYAVNEGGNGQDIVQNLLGSVLRIDVSTTEGYAIPSDNPFIEHEGMDEIYAYGFRNPYRFSFDSEWGLILGDVGQGLWEEVNIVQSGANYGWNVKEGFTCFNAADSDQPLEDCPTQDAYGTALSDPVLVYPHEYSFSAVQGQAVVGGYVYRGPNVPYLNGLYIFGDWSSGGDFPNGQVFAAFPSSTGQWRSVNLQISGRSNGELGQYLNSIARDLDGELYLLVKDTLGPSGSTGAVLRIAPTDIEMEREVSGIEIQASQVFEPENAIRFELEEAGNVSLTVHDVTGRTVRSLVSGPLSAGTHEIRWNGQANQGNLLPAGVYFYKLEAGAMASSRRVVVVR
jgi:glucose/arabinose dehydrogenase